jgi:hypothetical protein
MTVVLAPRVDVGRSGQPRARAPERDGAPNRLVAALVSRREVHALPSRCEATRVLPRASERR